MHLMPRGSGFRYGEVLVVSVAFAVFALVAPEGSGVRVIEAVAAGAILELAVLTSNAPKRTRRAAGLALGIAVVLGAGAATVGDAHPVWTYGATAILLAATAGVISAGVGRLVIERGVVLQAVLGALSIYVLLGLTFGFVVGTIASAQSQPFFAQSTDATQAARVYYSFTVMTTTGFGDYTAATRGGRALAVLEMLIGQIYLVTVIALLVGNLRRRRE
jgi:ion channel